MTPLGKPIRSRFWAALRLLALPLGLLLVGGCAYLAEKQGELIFRPVTGTWRGFDASIHQFDEHWVPVGGNGDRLHGWWLQADKPDAPVMLYLHGARWNLSGSVTRIDRWRKLGFSVFAVDYRGFGKSAAVSPTESLAYEDAEASWDYLAKLAPGRRRYIVGHSLGGAVAVELAKRRSDASGVVLEATFTSVSELISEYGYGYLPVGLLLTQRFDTLAKIGEIRVPILITHGTQDRIVPFAMGERLYQAAKAPKRFIKVEGGTHHNLSYAAFDEYRLALKELFAF